MLPGLTPKTIRAWAFSLTHVETGDVLGIAIVCAEARYLDDTLRAHTVGW